MGIKRQRSLDIKEKSSKFETARSVLVSFIITKATAAATTRYQAYRENRFYNVSATAKDLGADLFSFICSQLGDMSVDKEFKSFMVSRTPSGAIVIPNSDTPFNIMINGIVATVSIKSPNKIVQEAIDNQDWTGLNQNVSAIFKVSSKDPAIKDAIGTMVANARVEMEKSQREIFVYLPYTWGWESKFKAPVRKLSSVFLKDDLTEDILADLQKFLASADHYESLGMPHHRAYCFHGPPGTGKSSFLTALCHEIKYNPCYLSIHDIKSDSTLLGQVASLPDYSVLIVEDIDTMNVDREENTEKISLGSLLNALDGIVTPPGLITFLTTNNLDVLDEALIRKGRIDRIIEIGYTEPVQVNGIFKKFYDIDVGCKTVPANTPMSNITELFKTHDTSTEILSDLKKAGFTFTKRK